MYIVCVFSVTKSTTSSLAKIILISIVILQTVYVMGNKVSDTHDTLKHNRYDSFLVRMCAVYVRYSVVRDFSRSHIERAQLSSLV